MIVEFEGAGSGWAFARFPFGVAVYLAAKGPVRENPRRSAAGTPYTTVGRFYSWQSGSNPPEGFVPPSEVNSEVWWALDNCEATIQWDTESGEEVGG